MVITNFSNKVILYSMRNSALIFTVLILASCSSRQPFQNSGSANKDQEWWECSAKSEREWRCSDGEQVEETVDLIGPQSETSITSNELAVEPTLVEVIPETQEVTSEAIVKENVQEPSDQLSSIIEEPINDSAITEPVQEPTIEPIANINTGDWVIQLGAYRSENEALKASEKVEDSRIETHNVGGVTWYRVIYGSYSTKNAANQAAFDLQQQYSVNTWVRKN